MPKLTKSEIMKLWSGTPSSQYLIAQTSIMDAIVLSKGNFCVSFSGGKDSCLLLYMVSEIAKDMGYTEPIKVAFADTTNEFRGIYDHIPFFLSWLENKFGLSYDYKRIRPTMRYRDQTDGKIKTKNATFQEVVRTKGYPFISKEVSKMIHALQNDTQRTGADVLFIRKNRKMNMSSVENLREAGFSNSGINYLTGYSRTIDGFNRLSVIPSVWIPMLFCDFHLSDQCCSVLKKTSLKFDGVSITGEMADESKLRLTKILESGCVGGIVDGVGKASPLGTMTQQTALSIIKEKEIPIASPYGDISCCDGVYRCSKLQRTGCVLCGFGIKFDENRFIISQEFDHQKIKYAFTKIEDGGLGYSELIQYINEFCETNIKIPII